MIAGGIELFTLRQRRSATGDHYFTGRIGNALVVVTRDEFERDLWKVVACDPAANPRDHGASPARLPARPADDGWYQTNMNDDVPADLDILIEVGTEPEETEQGEL